MVKKNKRRGKAKDHKRKPRIKLCHATARSKAKYSTKEEAETEMRFRQALHKGRKVPVRTYQCPECNHWHLSSSLSYNDKEN